MTARIMTRTLSFVALAAALGLGGCVSLLPKEKPAQLYRFGGASGDAATADGHQRGLVLGEAAFPREASIDGILTVTENRIAYISGVRWVAPAAILFRQAIPAAFDGPGSRTRVLTRGEVGQSVGVLQLNVARFEADYARDGTDPTISVIIRARLSNAGGQLLAERDFQVEKPAGANRVSAIVPAFDAAVREVLAQIVAWTDQSLDANPAPPPYTSSTTSSTTTTTTHRP